MIDLETWKKVVNDPRAEVAALFKRPELTFADMAGDPLSFHMQAALWGILRSLDEAFSRHEYCQNHPDGDSEYFQWEAVANKTFALGLLRSIREHADEMTAVLADRKSRDDMLNAEIAQQIRAELVCCDIYERFHATSQSFPVRSFHEGCYHGEYAARIAEGTLE